jgi:hypothetical protein
MGNGELTERIRQRAYEIWESEGKPQDRSLIHWMRAEAEIHEKALVPNAKLLAPTKSRRKSVPLSKPRAKFPQQPVLKH